jgi:hypothetical protein
MLAWQLWKHLHQTRRPWQKDESRLKPTIIYQVLSHSSQAKIKKIKHSRIGEQMQTWLTSNKTHHILSNCHPPTYYHNYSYQLLSGWLTLANTRWGMKIKMLLQRKNLFFWIWRTVFRPFDYRSVDVCFQIEIMPLKCLAEILAVWCISCCSRQIIFATKSSLPNIIALDQRIKVSTESTQWEMICAAKYIGTPIVESTSYCCKFAEVVRR